MAKDYVKVATYSSSEEAHLAKIRLAENDIECMIFRGTSFDGGSQGGFSADRGSCSTRPGSKGYGDIEISKIRTVITLLSSAFLETYF